MEALIYRIDLWENMGWVPGVTQTQKNAENLYGLHRRKGDKVRMVNTQIPRVLKHANAEKK